MPATEEEQAYDAVYRYAHEQMSNGVQPDQIEQALVAEGWDAGAARVIVGDLRSRSDEALVGVATPQKATGKGAKLNYQTPTAYRPAAQKPKARSSSGGGGGGGERDMMVGGLICAVGLLITIGTYAAASSGTGGGQYTVAWGAILFGGIRFVKGLASTGK